MTAAFAALLLHNLILLARNQLSFDRDHRLGLHHATLGERARDSRNGETREKAGIYHLIRERIAGATVVIPPGLGEAGWWMERVGRVHVFVADAPLALPAADAAALRHRASHVSRLRAGGQTRPIAFVFADRAARYVVADAGDGLILLPEPMYARPTP